MKTKEFKFKLAGMPAVVTADYSRTNPDEIEMIRLKCDVYVACGENQIRDALPEGVFEKIIMELEKVEST